MTVNVNWKPCTEELYWYMLEVLPPRYMGQWGFLVGEPADHRECATDGLVRARYDAFLDMGENTPERFFAADRPLTVPEFKNSNRPR